MRLLYINLIQALRHIRGNWKPILFSVVGLALSLVCFTLSASDLWYRTHYDSFREKSDQLYLLQTTNLKDGLFNCRYMVSDKYVDNLRQRLPQDTRLSTATSIFLGMHASETENAPSVKHGLMVDSLFPGMLDVRVLDGKVDDLYRSPNQVVLTDSMALLLFGTTKVVGRSINYVPPYFAEKQEEGIRYVAAVVRYETYTAVPFWYLYPCEDLKFIYRDESKVLIRTDNPDEVGRQLALCDSVNNKNDVKTRLQPLRLVPILDRNPDLWNAAFYPLSFCLLSVLLLVSALFNFTALLTSMCLFQLREYRLRICLGGGFRDNVCRLFVEVLLIIVGVCLLGGVLLEWAYLLYQPEITKGELYVYYGWFCLGLLGLMLLFASYPLYRLHSLYKFSLSNTQGGKALQGVLLLIQMTVSVLLFFLVINGLRQFRFMTHDGLGFSADRVLSVKAASWKDKTAAEFMRPEVASELRNASPAVEDARAMQIQIFEPGASITADGGYFREGLKTSISLFSLPADAISFFELEVKDLQGLPMHYEGRRGEALVNSKARQLLGIGNEGICYGSVNGTDNVRVIGTLDYRNRSFGKETLPTLFMPDSAMSGAKTIYVKYLPGKRAEAVSAIRQVVTRHELSLEQVKVEDYSEHILSFYKEEQHYLLLFILQALVGLCVTILGVQAFVSYELRRNRRSMAIRRVFGVTYWQLLRFYLWRYVWVAMLGAAVALPLGLVVLSWWLQKYAEQVSITWWSVAVPLCTVLFFIFVVVVLKVRAMMRENPAEVIKAE